MERRLIKRLPFLLTVTLLVATLPLPCCPAAAEDDPISLTAQVGFDGFYKEQLWTPVRVTVANSGPDVEGFLVVELPGNAPSSASPLSPSLWPEWPLVERISKESRPNIGKIFPPLLCSFIRPFMRCLIPTYPPG